MSSEWNTYLKKSATFRVLYFILFLIVFALSIVFQNKWIIIIMLPVFFILAYLFFWKDPVAREYRTNLDYSLSKVLFKKKMIYLIIFLLLVSTISLFVIYRDPSNFSYFGFVVIPLLLIVVIIGFFAYSSKIKTVIKSQKTPKTWKLILMAFIFIGIIISFLKLAPDLLGLNLIFGGFGSGDKYELLSAKGFCDGEPYEYTINIEDYNFGNFIRKNQIKKIDLSKISILQDGDLISRDEYRIFFTEKEIYSEYEGPETIIRILMDCELSDCTDKARPVKFEIKFEDYGELLLVGNYCNRP